ncbi:MAG: non-heme iron oxygenase ferredoxin subunit [Burkholderiales bacterium]|jgi:3-phenylpropionate/trans-cinnamate dioxygenase ferredoxin subunit|nr:non-heme iron oxygenase ferredoxin subunit [Pseudomonadota bacterium]MDA1012363.1 non-heme iron oxygenase ferredoxin subunit [Pseudomonadota bacterium]
MSDWQKVCSVTDVQLGKWCQTDLDGTIVVIYNLDGQFFAIEDVCTHDGAILSGCPLEGDEVVCPRHGARFSVKTGEALSAPAWEATATFPIKIENDHILIRDNRWD